MSESNNNVTGVASISFLNSDEMLLIAKVAETGEHLQALFDDIEIRARGADAPIRIDKMWLALARTRMQEGLMALNRAIARPKTF